MSDIPELDQLIQNYEFDNEQYLKCIQRENKLIKNFTRDIDLTNLSVRKLQESVSQVDEDTKRVHKQYTLNRDNISSLKKTSKFLADHDATLRKKLEAKTEKNNDEMNERYKLLAHYQSVWEDFEHKYKSCKPAQILEKEMKNLSLAERFLCNMQGEKEHIAKNLKDNKLMTTEEVKQFIVSLARVKNGSNQLKEKVKTLKENLNEMKQIFHKQQIQDELDKTTPQKPLGAGNVTKSPIKTAGITTTTTSTAVAIPTPSIASTATNGQHNIPSSLPSRNIARPPAMKLPPAKPSKEILSQLPLLKPVNVPKRDELSRTPNYLNGSVSAIKPVSSVLLPKHSSIGSRKAWGIPPATTKSQFQDTYLKPLKSPSRPQLQNSKSTFSLAATSMDKMKQVIVPITSPSKPNVEKQFQMQISSPQLSSFASMSAVKIPQKETMSLPLQSSGESIPKTPTGNEIEGMNTLNIPNNSGDMEQNVFSESSFNFTEHQKMLQKLHSSPGVPSMSTRPMFQLDEDQQLNPEPVKNKTDTNFFLQSFFEKQDNNEESMGVSMMSQSSGDNESNNLFSGFSQASGNSTGNPLEFNFSNSEDMASTTPNEGNFFFNTSSFSESNNQNEGTFSLNFGVSSNPEPASSQPFSLF